MTVKGLPADLKPQAYSVLKEYERYFMVKGNQVSVDAEDGMQIPLLPGPGLEPSQACLDQLSSPECDKVTNVTEITPTGNMVFKTETKDFLDLDAEGNPTEEDPPSSKILVPYIEISYLKKDAAGELVKDADGKALIVKGWIPHEQISFKPVASIYAQITKKKINDIQNWLSDPNRNDLCVKPSMAGFGGILEDHLRSFAKIAKVTDEEVATLNVQRSSVVEMTKRVAAAVGVCAMDPTKDPAINPQKPIVYDQAVLPKLSSVKGVKPSQLMEIDALARTIYAEMASCTMLGTQYPMAVARVLLNRAEAMDAEPKSKKEFIYKEAEHKESKSLLTMAATSPVQFSSWNQSIIDFKALAATRASTIKKKIMSGTPRAEAIRSTYKEVRPRPPPPFPGRHYKVNKSGLQHALCPPSDTEKICYTGRKPDGNLNQVWQETLKVATEAVMFRSDFLKKTSQLDGVKHYTSGRSSFAGYLPVRHVSIESRALQSPRCLNLWRKPPPKAKK